MHHQECIVPNVDISLQSGQFWATTIASFRETLLYFRSCWIVFNHVVWGFPGGLLQFSNGEAVKIFLASVLSWHLQQSVVTGPIFQVPWARVVLDYFSATAAPSCIHVCVFAGFTCREWPNAAALPYPHQHTFCIGCTHVCLNRPHRNPLSEAAVYDVDACIVTSCWCRCLCEVAVSCWIYDTIRYAWNMWQLCHKLSCMQHTCADGIIVVFLCVIKLTTTFCCFFSKMQTSFVNTAFSMEYFFVMYSLSDVCVNWIIKFFSFCFI